MPTERRRVEKMVEKPMKGVLSIKDSHRIQDCFLSRSSEENERAQGPPLRAETESISWGRWEVKAEQVSCDPLPASGS